MSRLRKILIFFFISLAGITIAVFIIIFLKREYLFAKLIDSANENFHSYGYSLSYEDATIRFFLPRLSMSGVVVTDIETGKPVLKAERSYLSIKPLKLIIPGASPLILQVEQFRGSVEKKLLDSLTGSTRSPGAKKPKKAFIPTLVLKNGFLEILGPWKFINEAKLSIKSLYFSGNIWEGLGIIYTTGDEGVTAAILHGGREYPLQISSLHVNSHILTDKIDIKKLSLNSPYGSLSLSGLYDLHKEELEGRVTGDVNTERIVRDYNIESIENFVQGGRVKFSGSTLVRNGRINLNIDTEIINVSVKGFKCNGFASCVYDDGNVSLKRLAINTRAGKLSGDVRFDVSSFQGEGEFDIIDFYPGKLAEFLIKDSAVGAEGKGNGHIVFSAAEKGTITLRSELQMEEGFSLVLRELDERIEWAEPVALNAESVITGIFKNPIIEVTRLSIADKENLISLQGTLDVIEKRGNVQGNIDITQVKSLNLKGIFARSGAIKGDFAISGNLSNPLLETSFSLREISFRDLPPGNVFLKGSGILERSISVIADYTSPIGSILFSGTYFPDKQLYFTGSLTAENVNVGPFSSESFLEKGIYDSLKKRFPFIFPITGNVSFEGDLVLGKDTINARGRLSADQIHSQKMDLQTVKGDIEYDNGKLNIEDISFEAFGGSIRSKGSFSKDIYELLGNFSNINPNSLSHILTEDKQLVSGESLEGAFHVRFSGERVDELDIHLTSDNISFQGADLSGLIVDGRKKGEVLALVLSTSNNLVNLELNYDLVKSGLFGNIKFGNFPIKVSDKPYGQNLGMFGIKISGSAEIGLKGIYNLPVSLSGFFFNADSLNLDLKATPFFTRYEGNLPEFHVDGRNRDGTIMLEITSSQSEGTVQTLFDLQGKKEVFLTVRGRMDTGLFPVVLPSKIIAKMKSDLSIDLQGPLKSVFQNGSGRLLMSNLNIEFPGERIKGEKLFILLDKGRFTIERSPISANFKTFFLSGTVGPNGQVDLLLSGDYDAGLVNAIVRGIFEKITGKVVGNIQVRGRFPEVEVSGRGVGEDIFIKFVGFKHPLRQVTTELSFFKDRILFDSINGTMSGGELDGSGEVNIVKDAPVNLSFNADFYGVNLSYPEELPSKVEGSIELLGPVEGLLLRGELYVDRAVYTTPIYPEKFLVDLKKKIEKFNAPVGRAFAINLDLECISDGTIFVKNNISEAAAGGSFRLLGDTSRPVIIGTFEAIEGEVEYRGTDYTIERLLVDFDNPISNNPNIDAFARAEKGDYTIFVEVTGRLDNYSVELYSEPPLSKNDIVSLLSLGVTTEAYSEEGSSVTTAGLATVALSPLTTQIEESIRTFTGFERFSVGSNYSPATGVVEPTVVIGKNIGDRFSIDFSTSLAGTGTTNVIGEFRLIRDLYFRGDWTGGGTADEGELGGELRVKKRFHNISEFVEKLFGGESW